MDIALGADTPWGILFIFLNQYTGLHPNCQIRCDTCWFSTKHLETLDKFPETMIYALCGIGQVNGGNTARRSRQICRNAQASGGEGLFRAGRIAYPRGQNMLHSTFPWLFSTALIPDSAVVCKALADEPISGSFRYTLGQWMTGWCSNSSITTRTARCASLPRSTIMLAACLEMEAEYSRGGAR